MRCWICQSCKSGQVDDVKPTKCLYCGKIGGGWEEARDHEIHFGSFKTYRCTNCDYRVEETQPPLYPCPNCFSNSWKNI